MKFLVFQHINIEHPGVFRDFMVNEGIEWDTVELDEGDSIPMLQGYDALWVMGGPMDVWEEDKYPWLIDEKRAIREAVVERRLPFLGLCLGHQLLAVALDGECQKMVAPEVGVCEIGLTQAGLKDSLFAGSEPNSEALQWHGVEVTRLPMGGVSLASSPACAVQAQRVGDWAYSLQFHVEITESTVREWGAVPAYQKALETSLGPGALERLDAACNEQMHAFNNSAHKLFNNFLRIIDNRQS